jgi:hypothetical protein
MTVVARGRQKSDTQFVVFIASYGEEKQNKKVDESDFLYKKTAKKILFLSFHLILITFNR